MPEEENENLHVYKCKKCNKMFELNFIAQKPNDIMCPECAQQTYKDLTEAKL
jgi:DNA-directed RNA polymerase subunit RPC12/RpoP